MTTYPPAQTYGIKPSRIKKHTNPIELKLHSLLADQNHLERITAYEILENLPTLQTVENKPYARHLRYILMNSRLNIPTSTARELTNPSIWYALAGMK